MPKLSLSYLPNLSVSCFSLDVVTTNLQARYRC